MTSETYIAIRRFLGSRPHDETRQLIHLLEQMPAVTTQDIEVREKASKRLAELEEIRGINKYPTDGDLRAPEDESDRLPHPGPVEGENQTNP